jgi:transposase InsO family protein
MRHLSFPPEPGYDRLRPVCPPLPQYRVRHLRTRPYTPRTNGKAERFIQSLLREWAYRRPYPSSRERTEGLPAWLYYYNSARPHGAVHGRPPITRLAAPNNLVAVRS